VFNVAVVIFRRTRIAFQRSFFALIVFNIHADMLEHVALYGCNSV
jgi:hypothetical protein